MRVKHKRGIKKGEDSRRFKAGGTADYVRSVPEYERSCSGTFF